jgi:hypothetical protein
VAGKAAAACVFRFLGGNWGLFLFCRETGDKIIEKNRKIYKKSICNREKMEYNKMELS